MEYPIANLYSGCVYHINVEAHALAANPSLRDTLVNTAPLAPIMGPAKDLDTWKCISSELNGYISP
jgi:hypothetical protein